MKYAIIVTDGENVGLLGFTEKNRDPLFGKLLCNSREEALEESYAAWLRWGSGYFLEIIRVK